MEEISVVNVPSYAALCQNSLKKLEDRCGKFFINTVGKELKTDVENFIKDIMQQPQNFYALLINFARRLSRHLPDAPWNAHPGSMGPYIMDWLKSLRQALKDNSLSKLHPNLFEEKGTNSFGGAGHAPGYYYFDFLLDVCDIVSKNGQPALLTFEEKSIYDEYRQAKDACAKGNRADLKWENFFKNSALDQSLQTAATHVINAEKKIALDPSPQQQSASSSMSSIINDFGLLSEAQRQELLQKLLQQDDKTQENQAPGNYQPPTPF